MPLINVTQNTTLSLYCLHCEGTFLHCSYLETLKMEPIKTCRICGDKAKSFNYNGLPSCPSCRVFFRRNAASREKLLCRKGGKCDIGYMNRKSCTKCRLEKCFSIGMYLNNMPTNEVVMTVDSRLEKNIRDKVLSIFSEDNQQPQRKRLLHPKAAVQSICLSDFEQQKICEIQNAISVFEEESSLPVVRQVKGVIYLASLSQVYAKRIIRFCKRIPIFQKLEQADQLRLLKPFSFEIGALRGAFQFDRKNQMFTLLANESGTEAIIVQPESLHAQSTEPIDQNKQIFAMLNQEMENDKLIRNLLSAIMLVNPYTSNKECVNEAVRYQYHIYCYLLKRYLEHRYNDSELASGKYGALMKLIHYDLIITIKNMRKILLNFGVDQVAEIITEILSLKES